MRVWAQLFKRLPSRPLRISGEGLEWAYLDASRFATTDDFCPGARRAVFIAGYLPSENVSCGERPVAETESGSWLDWFIGNKNAPAEETPPAPRVRNRP